MSDVSVSDRLRVSRYLGLFGAVVLAVAAYLGGALPDSDLRTNIPRILARPLGPYSLAAWLVGTALMVAAWLLAGRAGHLTPRWVFTTAAIWALPFALAPPMGSRDVYAYACQGAVYDGGLDPYQFGASALPCPWLNTMSYVWRSTPAPYGPASLAITGGAVRVAAGNLWVAILLLRLAAIAGVCLTAVFVRRLAAACGVDEGRATWLALASPIIGVNLVSAAHNDGLMVGLCLAGLFFAVRRRPLASGVLLGLAVAVKATAGVALPFAVLAVVRPDRSLRRLLPATAWVVAGGAVAYGAASLATGLGFGWISALKYSSQTVQWTSLPTGVGMAVGYIGQLFGATAHLTHQTVGAARNVGMAVLAVALVAIWWRARGHDARRTVGYAGVALVAVTALSPVFFPWYWMLPIAVLAAAGFPGRWPIAVTAVAAFLVLPDGYSIARPTAAPGSLAVLAATIGALGWAAWRYLPHRAPVPAGAPTSGAPFGADLPQGDLEPTDGR
ncbi:polyprenol phosphomannose-dependent alpha 1,6 mannosyltransferase MptB [Planosporangium thailandense]|uniref:Polyprenol phosphomannose-dependent alpha 1,6 mannosyltransferase MptB n=1 Tax=Planosporangium thailandense TaxID=765197 RepID=A0ABX0XXK8_9ACTN|nr:polyprenol phosphomannose-dependent alpha 1,6 mannosyltransferase MptB [Planosporangium thailandense]NJC70784.1 polyprenol phosphomannose-dependent alpha 1,6 mannosyltransferase MptB [Planosporangium thailandense]